MASRGPGLYEFLIEAELQQYYACLKNDLKVQNASQLKYVSDEDLNQMGMSRPEMRRLKKYFQKHFPQNYISKFKKMILSKKEEQLESMLSMLPEEGVERPPVRVPNKHIIPAEAILVNKELGTGEFGIVQQGVWTNDGHRIQVAIKCLSRERMQSNPIEFLKEAAIMHGIDHEHIVRLYGVVLDTNALMLVTELAPLRSLLECLKEPSLRSSFPVLSLCDFAIQICDGMQYLETKRLIHRDLAARNILVFSKNKVKISDFGLSRALGVGKDYYQTNFNVNLKLPIAWCAPECISYLRFTSASDVWAYGVTLWEMFSYGFQPWAALTGHQILEAIDEPNFQRLEQPECCPKEYFNLMLKCWQHDPNKRPRFADLISLLPECKPEQVQAVQEGGGMGEERLKRDQLVYRASDIITVLDKSPPNAIGNCWKGVLNNGKTGLFNPANTIAYLGSNLPSNKPGEFVRSDGKTNTIYSSRRSRLRPDMISCPQGDFKHTSHVGLDGAYFGDISFLGGSKYNHIPHQVVTPYKPHEDNVDRSCSDKVPLLTTSEHSSSNGAVWNGDPDPIPPTKLLTDHEYHEISDEENVTESPRFEKTFDFGPSLLDEMDAMFKSLDSPSPSRPPPSPLDDTVNKRNELREMAAANNRKKQATVKPISAADERTLDTAIAMANELAARSMDNQLAKGNLPSPSPASPTKRKFSFHFPSSSSSTSASAAAAASAKTHRPQGKTFTDEAASRPDIQGCLSEEAKEVYNSLIAQPVVSSMADTNPLRMLRSVPFVRPRVRGNKHASSSLQHQSSFSGSSTLPSKCSDTLSLQKTVSGPALLSSADAVDESDHEGNGNSIPLPPRDRSKTLPAQKPRHQRKHPLIIPGNAARAVCAKLSDPPTSEPVYLGLQEEEPEAEEEASPENPEVPNVQEEATACADAAMAANVAQTENCESGGDSTFDDRLADALDRLEEEEQGEGGLPLREHVSCEDLLEFACDAPNASRTRGKARGITSDEVRIMGKVLGPKVSEESRLAALYATDWDVHRAIKLSRLDMLLPAQAAVDTATRLAALEESAWDVAKAAGRLLVSLNRPALSANGEGEVTQV
ncbi:activated Cdc42 kinase-like isoform X3 [Nilaparvata lugens]|uniref:activated Cdc42 kinase-like isoform X3 n=1 Tax=Nilaparvata lugens TaxID=108931 RepID=UPI00193D8E89|nr:activated Cdc42 kinase-like isoform X3 [Nilaparvata lugens]